MEAMQDYSNVQKIKYIFMFQIKIAWNILIILLNVLSVIMLFAITVLEIQLTCVWNFVNVAFRRRLYYLFHLGSQEYINPIGPLKNYAGKFENSIITYLIPFINMIHNNWSYIIYVFL